MKKSNLRTRPQADILVAERKEAGARGLVCRDSIDIRYRPEVLLQFFFKRPTPRVRDLMRIVAAVAHADRRVPRRHSVCWGRDLNLRIPVSEPDFWESTASSLSSLLFLLTGDGWSFLFRKQAYEAELPKDGYLEFPPEGDIATAYSNGLDSFTVARLVASGEICLSRGDTRKKNFLLVTTGQNLHIGDTHSQFGYRVRRISVPFTVPRTGGAFKLREITYRSRALVFQTLAALAAIQSQSQTVVVGEAGQGSLGPSLTITGNEAADVRTHPIFTRKLSALLKLVLGSEVTFEHPLIWNTKGEALRSLVSAKLHDGWESTHSCAVQVRHQRNEGPRLHCGMCPNCLLRRQSIHAANLSDPDSNYDYGSGLEPILQKRAAQGLMPLVELATLRDTPLLSRVADRYIELISPEVGWDNNEAKSRIGSLIKNHRNELKAFLLERPKRSLLRRLGEALL
jgi:7-cyano-7-deazaguanine synthase in queuosine biosynthesis